MADGEKLLTDEEMQAIEEVVASGGLDGGGYNVGIVANDFRHCGGGQPEF